MVVDLPLPVEPVTRTRPLRALAIEAAIDVVPPSLQKWIVLSQDLLGEEHRLSGSEPIHLGAEELAANPVSRGIPCLQVNVARALLHTYSKKAEHLLDRHSFSPTLVAEYPA